MKAKELLRLYDAGRLDFRGETLRGQNFKGQNLSGADFSNADIRSANFTKAILKDTNFGKAQAGLQRRWAMSLVIVSWLLAGISGSSSAFVGLLVSQMFEGNHSTEVVIGGVALTVVVVYFIVTIRNGVGVGRDADAIADAIAVTIAITFAICVVVPVDITAIYTGYVLASFAVAVAVTIAGTTTGAVAFAVAGSNAGAVAVAGVLTITSTVAVVIPVTVAVDDDITTDVAIVVAVAMLLLSAYIGWRALRGDARDAWILTVAITFAAIGGTSFRGADLTDANYAHAMLKSADLRNVTITRTNWHQANKLDRARVGGTILSNSEVRDLLVTHRGTKKSYVGLNLQGANLVGADLSDADFTGADVSEATFEDAWLERANLTKTQALNTNFHQAKLTGACLEDWSINSTTQLKDVICEYVYLLRNQQERRPSSGNFAPGEFTKLFEEVLDTIDLIFRNGVDWKAFVSSFKQVQSENEDTELTIQSIENKGDRVVVVKVQAPPNANKEKIHSDFTRNYELALKVAEDRYKAELQAKDEQIVFYRQQSADMLEIVKLQASKPINVDVKATADSKAMQGSSDQSRKIEIGNIGGDFNASGSVLNLGDISGAVTNTINQLPTSYHAGQPGIKELLTQLQEAISAESTLSDDDRAEALEQVKTLAEAGQDPSDGAMQKRAKGATTMLKGIAAGLPDAAKLVEACGKLLPVISSIFGL